MREEKREEIRVFRYQSKNTREKEEIRVCRYRRKKRREEGKTAEGIRREGGKVTYHSCLVDADQD